MAIYKLGELCKYVEGYVNPPINNSKYFGGNEIAWMKVADLKHSTTINVVAANLSKEGVKLIKNKNQIFKKGTIIWSKSGSVGNVGILGIDVTANRGILNLLPYQEKLKTKFLYYWLIKNKNSLRRKATGAVLQHLYGPQLMKEFIYLPNIKIQKKIIDIIEQREELFLKHSNCVRIDSYNNTKNDMKKLIDIIEPIELLLENIQKTQKLIKELLLKKYFILENEQQKIMNFCVLKNQGYKNQQLYLATNAIGEMDIQINKVQKISKNRPSRANLTPENNSIILSKLMGENKLFFIKNNKFVFSTGFFNIVTEYIDHFMGFFLSDDFKKQKQNYSSGTTMIALNNLGLKNIKLKTPPNKTSDLTTLMWNLINLSNKIKNIKNQIIQLLIK